MKLGNKVRVKIREDKKVGGKVLYAEGIINGIVPEFGHITYIVSDAKIVGDIKTRKPIDISKKVEV